MSYQLFIPIWFSRAPSLPLSSRYAPWSSWLASSRDAPRKSRDRSPGFQLAQDFGVTTANVVGRRYAKVLCQTGSLLPYIRHPAIDFTAGEETDVQISLPSTWRWRNCRSLILQLSRFLPLGGGLSVIRFSRLWNCLFLNDPVYRIIYCSAVGPTSTWRLSCTTHFTTLYIQIVSYKISTLVL